MCKTDKALQEYHEFILKKKSEAWEKLIAIDTEITALQLQRVAVYEEWCEYHNQLESYKLLWDK